MRIEVIILGHDFLPSMTLIENFSHAYLLGIARIRKESAINKGQPWVKDGISVFGLKVIESLDKASTANTSHMIAQLASMIMVYELTFLHVGEDIYNDYSMMLTINQNGLVGRTL